MSNIADANAKMRKGKAALKTSLFKWSPDYLLAAHAYDQAATHFRLGNDLAGAAEAHVQAADAHYHAGSVFASAQATEKAAQIGVQSPNVMKLDRACELYEKACYLFQEGGDVCKASVCMHHCAKYLAQRDGVDKDLVLAKYKKACDLLEGTGKEVLYMDLFRECVGYCVECGRLKDASEMNARLSKLYEGFSQKSNLYKCHLADVILKLAVNDRVAARQSFESKFDDVAYLKSDECEVAENLLRAFENNDEDQVKEITSKSVILRYLDRHIGMLARKLDPFKSVAPGAAAAASSATPSSNAAGQAVVDDKTLLFGGGGSVSQEKAALFSAPEKGGNDKPDPNRDALFGGPAKGGADKPDQNRDALFGTSSSDVKVEVPSQAASDQTILDEFNALKFDTNEKLADNSKQESVEHVADREEAPTEHPGQLAPTEQPAGPISTEAQQTLDPAAQAAAAELLKVEAAAAAAAQVDETAPGDDDDDMNFLM